MSKKKFIKFYSDLYDKLFPINRSIIGDGYLKSLKILNHFYKFNFIKFQSGTKIFDWKVPKEWVIKDGYILTPKNKKICDFKKNNLHITSYSKKIDKTVSFRELIKVLNFKKELPNAVPYNTSYYKKSFSFNISYNQKKN